MAPPAPLRSLEEDSELPREPPAKKLKTTATVSAPVFNNLHPPENDDVIVDTAIALRTFFNIVDGLPAENLLRLHFASEIRCCGRLFMATTALMTLLGHNRYDISESPAGVMYVSTRSKADAVMLDSQVYGAFGVILSFHRVGGPLADLAANCMLPDINAPASQYLGALSLDGLYILAQAANQSARSASEIAERNEMALLELRRENADLLKLVKEISSRPEPSNQNYFDALKLGPDPRKAIKWPITCFEEFKTSVVVALAARGLDPPESSVSANQARVLAPSVVHLNGIALGKRKAPDHMEPAPFVDLTGPISLDSTISEAANKLAFLLSNGAQMTMYLPAVTLSTPSRARLPKTVLVLIPFVLCRDWVQMDGAPPVRVTGLALKGVASGDVDIDNALGDAFVRELNNAEFARFKSDSTKPPQLYLPPSFVLQCLGRPIGSHLLPIEMLAPQYVGYDIRYSREFVALVPVEDAWACYAWDFINLRFTLVDPLCYGQPDISIQTKHAHTYNVLACTLKKVLQIIHAKDCIGEGTWVKILHSQVGPNCPRNSTGVFSLTAARVVDIVSGAVSIGSFDMVQSTKDMVYRVVKSDAVPWAANRFPLLPIEMLAPQYVGYDIRYSREFVALVPVEDAWACYAWDFINLRFTLVNPLFYGQPDISIQTKHAHTYNVLACTLKKVLQIIHAKDCIGEGTWVKILHSQVGRNCPRNSTGVFSLTAARVVDIVSGAVSIGSFDMVQSTKDMVYRVVKSGLNKAN
ncbi:hypothetical protein ACQ4PT_013840 [Festuca glaucescens]